MRFVGIDPGRTGALVAVGDDGLTVLDVQTWRNAEWPPELRVRAGDVVAIEAPYVGKSRRGSLTLATWCGGASAQCRVLGIVPLRPTASQWRGKVLRQAAMRRDVAKAAAIAAAERFAIGGPDEWTVDSAEAWAMARWAWGWARTHREAA